MGKIVYDKLVRDKIPQRLETKVKYFKTRVISGEEYNQALNNKLQEEVKEYLESGSVEEIADIVEVLRAVLELKGISLEDFEQVREQKANDRGAFKERIFLEYVEE